MMFCLVALTAWAQESDDYLSFLGKGKQWHVLHRSSADYAAFVEENKVWKVGRMQELDSVVCELEYFYFDGDTLVDGRTCKKWVRQDEDEQNRRTFYVGALYEKGKRIYLIRPLTTTPVLLYDFESPLGSYVEAYDVLEDTVAPCYIAEKYTRDITACGQEYHLPCTQVRYYPTRSDQRYVAEWVESIGSLGEPNYNSYGDNGYACVLLECSIGAKRCYYNPHIEETISSYWWDELLIDGTASGTNKNKDKLDFTHVIKTRPTLYAKPEDQQIGGEYSNCLLAVDFANFSGSYVSTVIDAAGQILFSQTVNTGNLMSLELQLSEYSVGQYTIAFENDEEIYTAQFSLPLIDSGVGGIVDGGAGGSSSLYDLCGRHIKEGKLGRGVYIRDGRKSLVR